MNYSFLTTNKEIDLTIVDDSCKTDNPRGVIFWRLDIENNGYGITGMTPRIEKIDVKWDVIDEDGHGERHEIIQSFKGRELGKDHPNAWELTEEIWEEFGHFYVDEVIIDLNSWSVAVTYNRDTEGNKTLKQ